MKILYISTDYGIPILGRKGASVHIRELVNAFVNEKHRVILTSPLDRKSLWETAESVNAEFLHLPASDPALEFFHIIKSYTNNLAVSGNLAGEIRRIVYGLEVEPRLIRKFTNDPPDFIYVRAALFSTVGVTLAKELRKPLIVELNAPLSDEHVIYRSSGLGEAATAAERSLLRHADAVLTVSKSLREHVKNLDVDESKIHVFPNAINHQRFFPADKNEMLRKKMALGEGPVLGFVGGLRPWHGVDSLVTLVQKLAPKHPRLKLIIVGDGPLRQQLETEISKRGLAANILFTGACTHAEVADLIRLFDIALAPYPETEHHFYFSPLKLFEYMGCGVPVVAARIGQIEELITHQENGLLYSPGDDVELSTLCDKLLCNPELAKRLGQNASNLIHQHYTWERNAKRVVDIANEIAV